MVWRSWLLVLFSGAAIGQSEQSEQVFRFAQAETPLARQEINPRHALYRRDTGQQRGYGGRYEDRPGYGGATRAGTVVVHGTGPGAGVSRFKPWRTRSVRRGMERVVYTEMARALTLRGTAVQMAAEQLIQAADK